MNKKARIAITIPEMSAVYAIRLGQSILDIDPFGYDDQPIAAKFAKDLIFAGEGALDSFLMETSHQHSNTMTLEGKIQYWENYNE